MEALTADTLHHSYRRFPWSRGRVALDGVSITVGAGELHLLAGANGAGKSTLLQLLAGLLRPTRGRIELFGHPPGARAIAGRLAWVPEGIDSTSRLTARETIELQAAIYGRRGRERREQVDAHLAEVGLTELAGRQVRFLSKGERRRVALAQALVSGADLLLLDEPLDGVDPESSELLLGRLAARCREGMSVLLSTHVLLDGRHGGDRLTVLDRGRVVASGPPAQLLERDGPGASLSFAELLRRARARAAS